MSLSPKISAESQPRFHDVPVRRSGFRWPWGLLILGLILSTWIGVAFYFEDNRTLRVFWLMGVVVAGAAALLIWWLFFSGLSGRQRLQGVVVAGATGLLLTALFRFDGLDGAIRPRFVPRWWPTAEERRQEYFDSAETVPQTRQQLEIGPEDWPHFRGPQRDGIVRDFKLRGDWKSSPPKKLWSHPIGKGWSSFAVVDGMAITQEQRGEQEFVVCYDVENGKEIWRHADDGHFTCSLGGEGPRATPTVHDGRVYSLGAFGILNCLDALGGEKIWSRNILTDAGAENLEWGQSASPLVYDDVVVVVPGGTQGKGVAAYDRRTGEIVWQQGHRPTSYASPRLETIDGVRQILHFDGDGLTGLDPADGKLLWAKEWKNEFRINVAQPIVIEGRQIFASSGYGLGSFLIEPKRPTASGEWKVDVKWETPNSFRMKFNDAIYHDGHVYGLDESLPACLELATGKIKWKLRGKYGFGQMLLVHDMLLITTEQGEVALIPATPRRPQEIARFRALDERGFGWNQPVIWKGRLLVRNEREIACFDLRVSSPEKP